MSEVAGQGSSRRGGDPRPRFAAGTSFTDSFLNAAAAPLKPPKPQTSLPIPGDASCDAAANLDFFS